MTMSHRPATIDITSTPNERTLPVNTLLAPPDPSTRRPIVRDRPYGSFVDRAFDRSKSTYTERRLYRWAYRAFRQQKNSTTFGARAQFATTLMSVDSIKIDAATACWAANQS